MSAIGRSSAVCAISSDEGVCVVTWFNDTGLFSLGLGTVALSFLIGPGRGSGGCVLVPHTGRGWRGRVLAPHTGRGSSGRGLTLRAEAWFNSGGTAVPHGGEHMTQAAPTGTQAIDRAAQLLVRVVESTEPVAVGELAATARSEERRVGK